MNSRGFRHHLKPIMQPNVKFPIVKLSSCDISTYKILAINPTIYVCNSQEKYKLPQTFKLSGHPSTHGTNGLLYRHLGGLASLFRYSLRNEKASVSIPYRPLGEVSNPKISRQLLVILGNSILNLRAIILALEMVEHHLQ